MNERSKYTKEQARDAVMKMVEEKMSKEIAAYIKEREAEAKLEVDKKAKDLLVHSMQRYSNDVTNIQTVTTISLPNSSNLTKLIIEPQFILRRLFKVKSKSVTFLVSSYSTVAI